MKQLTIKDIVGLKPCYDPTKYLPEDWTGTVTDILKMLEVPVDDRLWVVVRQEFISEKTLQYFALACARQCEKYTTDQRVKKCNDVTEAYLKGEATKEDLDAATSATAYSARAARAASYVAFAPATYSVDAASYAARAASFAPYATAYSARAATYAAASTAARDAYSASYATIRATYAAARDIAQEEQCLLLIKLIEENEK